jgi:hypothetical protein
MPRLTAWLPVLRPKGHSEWLPNNDPPAAGAYGFDRVIEDHQALWLAAPGG